MKYRWAPSLGDFEESPEKVWGVEPYDPNGTEPCVFCGIYGIKDLMALWNYKGKRYVWYAGSDIRHFLNGYWIDDRGGIRMTSRPWAKWINKNCEVYVENLIEKQALSKIGIGAIVIPSFLGDVKKFPPQKIRTDRKRYYTSVSGDDFELYGWQKIFDMADENPDIEYHLYGNIKEPFYTPTGNIFIHGRVPKEQMNEEVKTMTGAIRMVEFEGFSEILAKSILWGQKPISLIPYDYTRESLLKVLNAYPWNTK